MLKVRYKLKQKHPSWDIFLRYPAKLVRCARDGSIKTQDVINSVDEDSEEDDELQTLDSAFAGTLLFQE